LKRSLSKTVAAKRREPETAAVRAGVYELPAERSGHERVGDILEPGTVKLPAEGAPGRHP
jgi:hypothetical protein